MSVSYVGHAIANRNSSTAAEFYVSSLPSGSSGDGLLVLIGWGNDTDTLPTAPASGIWTYLGTSDGGAGTWGVDSGPRHVSAWWCANADLMTVDQEWLQPGANATNIGSITRLAKTQTDWLTPQIAVGGDTNAGTSYSATLDRNPGGVSGAFAVWGTASIPDTQFVTTAMSWTGSGVSSGTQRTTAASTSGNDVRLRTYTEPITGTPTATPTASSTIVASGSTLLAVIQDGAVNNLPVANAGTDQNITPNNLVTLDGTASYDPEAETLTYSWAQLSGTAVTLSGATTAQPTFTPTVEDTYVFQLTVTEPDESLTATDQVSVIVADAPPAALFEGYTESGWASSCTFPALPSGVGNGYVAVIMWGNNSDTPLEYDDVMWRHIRTISGGTGVNGVNSGTRHVSVYWATNPGSSLTFGWDTDPGGATTQGKLVRASKNQSYWNIVVEGAADSAYGSNLSVSPTDPGGQEGDLAIVAGATIPSSTNYSLSLTWPGTNGGSSSLTSMDTGASGGGNYVRGNVYYRSVTGTSTGDPTIDATADIVGAIAIIRLRATSTQQNFAPYALAGNAQTVEPWTIVTLDASSSYDNEGSIASYAWVQTAGASVTLSGSGATRTFEAPGAVTQQTLTFEVTVTDGGALTDVSSVSITVLRVFELHATASGWQPLRIKKL